MTRKIDAAPESIILRSAYASDADFKRVIIAALIAGRVVRSAPEFKHLPHDAMLALHEKPVEVLPGIAGYAWAKEDDGRPEALHEGRFGFYRLEKI